MWCLNALIVVILAVSVRNALCINNGKHSLLHWPKRNRNNDNDAPRRFSFRIRIPRRGVRVSEKLTYTQTMMAGAVSRTCAQTIMHPANTFKTMLQMRGAKTAGVVPRLTLERLLRGADAQFIMSLPHGALYFMVIEQAKQQISRVIPPQLDFLADFTSSSISTVICSAVSTPQMVLTDRLMGGVYPSFPVAVRRILQEDGLKGFYAGWWPALAQKIPSYGLTWMMFQDFKSRFQEHYGVKPTNRDNFILGALSAAGATAVMNPMDTVKTRLVTQAVDAPSAYKGVADCFVRVFREEGPRAFYRSLPPRLVSVVPMIAIQFGVYEFMKQRIIDQRRSHALVRLYEERARRRERIRRVLRTVTGQRRHVRLRQTQVNEKALGLDLSGLPNIAILTSTAVDGALRNFGDTLESISSGIVVEVENARQGFFFFREGKEFPVDGFLHSGATKELWAVKEYVEQYVADNGERAVVTGRMLAIKTVAAVTSAVRTVGPFRTVRPTPGAIVETW